MAALIILAFVKLEFSKTLGCNATLGFELRHVAHLSLLSPSSTLKIIKSNCLDEKFLNCLQSRPTKPTKRKSTCKQVINKRANLFVSLYIKIR